MNTPDPCQPDVKSYIGQSFPVEMTLVPVFPTESANLVMPDGSPIVIEPPAPRRMLEFFAWETLGGAETDFAGLCDHLTAMEDVEKYRKFTGESYAPPDHYRGGCTGVVTIDVLQQLWGLPLCNLILAYVHGLNPSKVVVSSGETDCMSISRRVTIYVDDKDVVTKITQTLPVLYGCGADLETMREALADGRAARPQSPSTGAVGNTAALARADFQ